MGDDDDDKQNPQDGKKKVRVKGNKKVGLINNQEEVKDDKVEKVEKAEESKEKKQEATISSKDAPLEIRLEELLSELTLNDKPEETSPEDDKYVEEFISKLEKIKIEK